MQRGTRLIASLQRLPSTSTIFVCSGNVYYLSFSPCVLIHTFSYFLSEKKKKYSGEILLLHLLQLSTPNFWRKNNIHTNPLFTCSCKSKCPLWMRICIWLLYRQSLSCDLITCQMVVVLIFIIKRTILNIHWKYMKNSMMAFFFCSVRAWEVGTEATSGPFLKLISILK